MIRLLLPLFLMLVAFASYSPRPAHAGEGSQMLLPEDQRKFETGEEQEARDRGNWSRKKQRQKQKRKHQQQMMRKRQHRQAQQRRKQGRKNPPNSGDFAKDGDGTPVDQTGR